MANFESKEQSAISNQKSSASESVASQCASHVAWANCQVGDTFVFGNYPQDADGGIQPIEWQVLRRDDDGLLVISKYALDCKPYNEEYCEITWSDCTLRKWLNSEFINKAFDAAERQQIKEVYLQNPNSHWSNMPGGPDTVDKVFLLSYDEAESLFATNAKRKCKPTEYAKKNNVGAGNGGMCYWWLRSPGDFTASAAGVFSGGAILSRYVIDDYDAVRPAFKIAL